jgi:post-segregation antitoxin (ccd killing protein)
MTDVDTLAAEVSRLKRRMWQIEQAVARLARFRQVLDTDRERRADLLPAIEDEAKAPHG